jgi:hypothetical protein
LSQLSYAAQPLSSRDAKEKVSGCATDQSGDKSPQSKGVNLSRNANPCVIRLNGKTDSSGNLELGDR